MGGGTGIGGGGATTDTTANGCIGAATVPNSTGGSAASFAVLHRVTLRPLTQVTVQTFFVTADFLTTTLGFLAFFTTAAEAALHPAGPAGTTSAASGKASAAASHFDLLPRYFAAIIVTSPLGTRVPSEDYAKRALSRK